MKRMVVVVAMVVLFAFVVANANQVKVGNQVLIGKSLAVGLTMTEDHFYGSVTLPCSGYLYIFYQPEPGADQYMIFPSPQARQNYVKAGFNILHIDMLCPTGKKQRMTVVFSPLQLFSPNFCGRTVPYLSTREIGLRCNICADDIWVGERVMTSVKIGHPSQYTGTPAPSLSSCVPCVSVRTAPKPCYPNSCCWNCSPIAFWLMMGIMIGH